MDAVPGDAELGRELAARVHAIVPELEMRLVSEERQPGHYTTVPADDPQRIAFAAFLDRQVAGDEFVEIQRTPTGFLAVNWLPPSAEIRDAVGEEGWEAVYGFPIIWLYQAYTDEEPRRVVLPSSVGSYPLRVYAARAGTRERRDALWNLIQHWHSHIPGRPAGEMFFLFVFNGPALVTIGVIGRPEAQMLWRDGARTLSVLRVATWAGDPQLAFNSNSLLYGAAAKEARRLGWEGLYTYTLAYSETGASVRAAGFHPDGWTKAERSWSREGRQRGGERVSDPKVRWLRRLFGPTEVVRVLELTRQQRDQLTEGVLAGSDLDAAQREKLAALLGATERRQLKAKKPFTRYGKRYEPITPAQAYIALHPGDQIYNLDAGRYEFWDGDRWWTATRRNYQKSALYAMDEGAAEQVMARWRRALSRLEEPRISVGARYEHPIARPRRFRGMPPGVFESVRPKAQHHFEVWYWTREDENEEDEVVSFLGMSEPYNEDYEREVFATYEEAASFVAGLETGFQYGWQRDPTPLTAVGRLNDAFRKGNDAGVGAGDISYYMMNPVSVLLADLPRDPALWIASRWLHEDSELDLEELSLSLAENDGADIQAAGREITWHVAEAKGDITPESIQPGTDPDATFPGLGAHVAAYLEAILATRTPEAIEWENEGGRHEL